MKKILLASTCAVIIVLVSFTSVASARVPEPNDTLSNQIVNTDDIPPLLQRLFEFIDFLKEFIVIILSIFIIWLFTGQGIGWSGSVS